MSEAKLGLTIVGCGQIVTHHLAAMDDSSFEVRALCDPSANRRNAIGNLLSATHQRLTTTTTTTTSCPPAAQFNTLDELIQDETGVFNSIDVIFIAVPHDLHEAIAIQALQTGRIVVMEKPLAPTAESCDRLIQASIDSNYHLIIAEQSPYWQEVAMARDLIHRQGAIGSTIVTAAAYYYESMRDNVTSGSVEKGGGLGWRGSLARAGGGIALDGGLHWIRPLREMCGGRITKVVGVIRSHLQPSLQMEGESLGHALFEIVPEPPLAPQPEGSGPLVATYSCNMLSTAPMAHDTCPYFRVTGTEGEIVIHGDGLFKENPGAGGLRLYNAEHPTGKEMFPADRKGGFFLGFAGLWKHIATIIKKKDGVAAHETVIRGADDVRVVLALYKSAKTGRWESTHDRQRHDEED